MKVLVAEDDPMSARLVSKVLSDDGYEVVLATDGLDAVRMMEQPDAPQLVILDWMMPGIDGIEVCRAIRARPGGAYVYVVLVTARTVREDMVEAFGAGADDFVAKPFDVRELKARVRAGRRVLELQAANLRATQQLMVQLLHDPLTGALNRRGIREALDRELARSHRDGSSVGVMLADIDRFKAVNDSYGHAAGDVVIREVCERMRSSLRIYDAAGRYGGEEFLLVLPRCSAAKLAIIGERLRRAVARAPIHALGHQVSVTVSAGFAASEDFADRDADALIATADEALYRAKRGGRDRIEHATAIAS
jgi:two-component system cell cycle response regulator